MSSPHETRSSTDRLVQMANDIAIYYRSEPDRELAIDGMAQHLVRFWEPRMRQRIRAHVANGAENLSELAVEAVLRLPETAPR